MFFYSNVPSLSSSPADLLSEEDIKTRYPLHFLIWHDKHAELGRELKKLAAKNAGRVAPEVLEQKDLRHRTPLMLAVTLGHKQCARLLLDHNANVHATDASGFNVLHEAVTSADPDFIRHVLERKEIQRYCSRADGVPSLLAKNCDTSDFYLEMKWEFTSWMPFISRYCPHDTYKIYKSGAKVRVDTTLCGVDGVANWQRGNISFIFTGSENGAVFMEVDHEAKTIKRKAMKLITQKEIGEFLEPTDNEVGNRLTKPIRTTFVDTEKISFERAKSGIYGFRTDRVEQINGFECKCYVANTVEVVTKTRTEHLASSDREARPEENTGLSNIAAVNRLAGIKEIIIPNPFANTQLDDKYKRNPYKLSLSEYFNHVPKTTQVPSAPVSTPVEPIDLARVEDTRSEVTLGTPEKDIGIPREMNIKLKVLKAHLWLSDSFPLSLPEQILPIVDLMAISSSHFVKLRDFIAGRLPSGFPVKIEIPLFHVLSARITFGNIFALNDSVKGVQTTQTTDERGETIHRCKLDDSCFVPPGDYSVIGVEDDEDDNSDDDFLSAAMARRRAIRNGENVDEADDLSQAYKYYWNNQKLPTGLAPSTGNGSVVNGEPRSKEVSFMEVLNNDSPDSDVELKKALQLSLEQYKIEREMRKNANGARKEDEASLSDDSFHSTHSNEADNEDGEEGAQLRRTLERSKQHHSDETTRLEREEQEQLERVLKLSLTEK